MRSSIRCSISVICPSVAASPRRRHRRRAPGLDERAGGAGEARRRRSRLRVGGRRRRCVGSSISTASASIAGVGRGLAGSSAGARRLSSCASGCMHRVELAAARCPASCAARASRRRPGGRLPGSRCGPKTNSATTRMTRISAGPRFMVRSELVSSGSYRRGSRASGAAAVPARRASVCVRGLDSAGRSSRPKRVERAAWSAGSRAERARSRRARPITRRAERRRPRDEHPHHADDPSGPGEFGDTSDLVASCSNQSSLSSSRWKSRRSSGVSGGTDARLGQLGRQPPHLHAHAARHEQVDDAPARFLGDRTLALGALEAVRAALVVGADPDGEVVGCQLHVPTARAVRPDRRHRSPVPGLCSLARPPPGGVPYPSAAPSGRLRLRSRRHGRMWTERHGGVAAMTLAWP